MRRSVSRSVRRSVVRLAVFFKWRKSRGKGIESLEPESNKSLQLLCFTASKSWFDPACNIYGHCFMIILLVMSIDLCGALLCYYTICRPIICKLFIGSHQFILSVIAFIIVVVFIFLLVFLLLAAILRRVVASYLRFLLSFYWKMEENKTGILRNCMTGSSTADFPE